MCNISLNLCKSLLAIAATHKLKSYHYSKLREYRSTRSIIQKPTVQTNLYKYGTNQQTIVECIFRQTSTPPYILFDVVGDVMKFHDVTNHENAN